jgi:hypothetical protein
MDRPQCNRNDVCTDLSNALQATLSLGFFQYYFGHRFDCFFIPLLFMVHSFLDNNKNLSKSFGHERSFEEQKSDAVNSHVRCKE